MKVYIVSEGEINKGHEACVKCICATRSLAEYIVKAFSAYNLSITEFDLID